MSQPADYYLNLIDRLPVLIWASGRDAKCNYFNRTWLDFTGRTLRQELGAGWLEGVHPGDRDRLMESFLDTFRRREPFRREFRLRHRGGGYRWIADDGCPVHDAASGEFTGYIGNCHDITEQKIAEEARRQSEQQFQMLARVSPAGIFRTSQDGECVYVTQQWSEITGIAPQDALDFGWFQMFRPDDRGSKSEQLRRYMRNNEAFKIEFLLVDDNGVETPATVQGWPEIDEAGALRGYLGTVCDVHRFRPSEEESLKMSKIESLGVLAGGIAHDFNNLLTPILLNLSMAQNRLHQPGYFHEIHRGLLEAEEAAFRAKNLTQQLLTFAKGGQPLRKVVEVPKLLESAVRFAIHGSRIAATFDVAEDLWPANLDAGQFNQVLLNILLNAADAMPEGGTVHISASNVHCVEHPSLPPLEGRHVHISIADNGPGIDPEVRSKIFDPYYSTKPEGNGLGLATALSIVRKHSGHLCVDSKPGQGAVFSIFIPAATTPVARVPQLKPGAGGSRGRILVMDDEELIRSSLGSILRALGFEVKLARDGIEALNIYCDAKDGDSPIDVTLMDLTIQGGMGGKEAVAELMALDPDAKAVVCSGYSNDPIMANYRDYGFCGAIQKPFHPDELNILLNELLRPATS